MEQISLNEADASHVSSSQLLRQLCDVCYGDKIIV